MLSLYGLENVLHQPFETFLHKSRRLDNLKINKIMSYVERRILLHCRQGVLKHYLLGWLLSTYELHYWNPNELSALFYVT